MITAGNVCDIIFTDCEGFGITRYRKGNEKIDPSSERVIVHVQRQQGENVWRKGFVDVNLCAPDIKGEADSPRLEELERLAWQLLDKDEIAEFDGTKYTYRIYSVESEIADEQMKCHYVNVKLLFKVFNIN